MYEILFAPDNALWGSLALFWTCIRRGVTHLPSELMVDETGDEHCGSLVHESGLGHNTIQRHWRHLDNKEAGCRMVSEDFLKLLADR